MALGAGIATRWRRPRSSRGSWPRLVAATLLAGSLWSAGSAEAARLTGIKGAQAERYGRIVLKFDSPVSVKARVSGAVLVVAFSEAAGAAPERITAEMPDYVSAVRRDPDGLGLRLALQRPYRVNVQEVGETVFVDLLPSTGPGCRPPFRPRRSPNSSGAPGRRKPPSRRPSLRSNPSACVSNSRTCRP